MPPSWLLDWAVLGLGIGVLIIDYYMPAIGRDQLFPASYAATILAFISKVVSALLAELFCRHGLQIALAGTSVDGLILSVSLAARKDNELLIAQRMMAEVRQNGILGVGLHRFFLVIMTVISWVTISIWSGLAANLVYSSPEEFLVTSLANVSYVDYNNPFGWSACYPEVVGNNATFEFDYGLDQPFGNMLHEVYATGIADAQVAVRSASAYYLDDLVSFTFNDSRFNDPTQYTVMLPSTNDAVKIYNATLIAMNVSCNIGQGDKVSGFLNLSQAMYPPTNPNISSAYTTMFTTWVDVSYGYALFASPTNATMALVNSNNQTYMASPACVRGGLCNAFTIPTKYQLQCAIKASLINATVTKGNVATNIVPASLSTPPRVSLAVLGAKRWTDAPRLFSQVFNTWLTGSQWSWINRGYRFVYDPDAYVLSLTPTALARDYEVMLAYASLGLFTRPQNYSLFVNNVQGRRGCNSTSIGGGYFSSPLNATVAVSTPNLVTVQDWTTNRKIINRKNYSQGLALIIAIVVLMFLALFPRGLLCDCGLFGRTLRKHLSGRLRRGQEARSAGMVVSNRDAFRMGVHQNAHDFAEFLLQCLQYGGPDGGARGNALKPATAAAAKRDREHISSAPEFRLRAVPNYVNPERRCCFVEETEQADFMLVRVESNAPSPTGVATVKPTMMRESTVALKPADGGSAAELSLIRTVTLKKAPYRLSQNLAQ